MVSGHDPGVSPLVIDHTKPVGQAIYAKNDALGITRFNLCVRKQTRNHRSIQHLDLNQTRMWRPRIASNGHCSASGVPPVTPVGTTSASGWTT